MEQQRRRKYPVGIQTFSRLIREGYVYIDKTDLVWQMANEDNPFLFLARPRRFDKSLLASTLHSFFVGKRELFRGLKADRLEWDWRQYPVFELKMHETAQKALEQIDTKGYALPYDTDGRRVVKCGQHFNLDSRTLDEWVYGG